MRLSANDKPAIIAVYHSGLAPFAHIGERIVVGNFSGNQPKERVLVIGLVNGVGCEGCIAYLGFTRDGNIAVVFNGVKYGLVGGYDYSAHGYGPDPVTVAVQVFSPVASGSVQISKHAPSPVVGGSSSAYAPLGAVFEPPRDIAGVAAVNPPAEKRAATANKTASTVAWGKLQL